MTISKDIRCDLYVFPEYIANSAGKIIINLAKQMVSGVDIWLNTPKKPQEALGISGMKAAHNGIPSLSILDG